MQTSLSSPARPSFSHCGGTGTGKQPWMLHCGMHGSSSVTGLVLMPSSQGGGRGTQLWMGEQLGVQGSSSCVLNPIPGSSQEGGVQSWTGLHSGTQSWFSSGQNTGVSASPQSGGAHLLGQSCAGAQWGVHGSSVSLNWIPSSSHGGGRHPEESHGFGTHSEVGEQSGVQGPLTTSSRMASRIPGLPHSGGRHDVTGLHGTGKGRHSWAGVQSGVHSSPGSFSKNRPGSSHSSGAQESGGMHSQVSEEASGGPDQSSSHGVGQLSSLTLMSGLPSHIWSML
ncbi:MAG: hypothetical protein QOD77_359 [Thermoplasmata archaeon]|jgi:hypothetical protein|nr:hypothetical protein [Thermoplasmata archaeon]